MHWFASVINVHFSEGPHRFLKRTEIIKFLEEAGFEIKKEETTVIIPYGPRFITKIGEFLERMFKDTLMPLIGLRRIFVCTKH